MSRIARVSHLFDLLEGLKDAYRSAGQEEKALLIASCFSSGTGGVEVERLIRILGPQTGGGAV